MTTGDLEVRGIVCSVAHEHGFHTLKEDQMFCSVLGLRLIFAMTAEFHFEGLTRAHTCIVWSHDYYIFMAVS